jgi:hypothetical protein
VSQSVLPRNEGGVIAHVTHPVADTCIVMCQSTPPSRCSHTVLSNSAVLSAMHHAQCLLQVNVCWDAGTSHASLALCCSVSPRSCTQGGVQSSSQGGVHSRSRCLSTSQPTISESPHHRRSVASCTLAAEHVAVHAAVNRQSPSTRTTAPLRTYRATRT